MNDFSPRRILVRGVNWLGDAVMTTPALQRLREAHSQAHIALLTQAKLADLWTHHPAIDQVLAMEAEEGPFSVGKRLLALEFDTALVLPNSPRSALEPFLARIPRRIGYARPWRNFLLTQRVAPRPEEIKMHKRSVGEIRALTSGASSAGLSQPKPPPAAHHLHQYLHLVAALGAQPEPLPPFIAVTAAELEQAREKFGANPTPAGRGPILGLNVGAEYGPAKRWPRERFIAAAVELQRALSCHCWVFGGPGDVALATGVADALTKTGPVQCLAGRTSLRELCTALKLCDILLTNDTGPMHLAAAVGTPVVVPFGSTSPELTGPGLPGDGQHRFLGSAAPCSPCFLRECPIDFRCMTGISVETVVQAVREVLEARR
jgi:heptosyltransferase-2